MPRVLEEFAKRGLIPTKWYSAVTESGELQIDIQLAEPEPGIGDALARGLRQLVSVGVVLTSR
jgi:hypothetical protein